ncbi:MAG: copper resistance D family protein [Propioniciclava sp.]
MSEFGADLALERALGTATAAWLLGILTLAGLVVFDRYLRGRSRIAGRTEQAARVAWVVAVAGVIIVLPLTALRVAGAPLVALANPAVWLPAVQLPSLMTALAVILPGGSVVALAGRRATAVGDRVVLVCVGLMLIAPVLTGHTRTRQPTWLIVGADLVHLLVAAVWLGGVLGLLLLLTSENEGSSDPRLALAVVRRFSRVAAVSVVALAVSGAVMAALILPAPATLLTDPYGRTLLLKLGLVGAVIVIAAGNRRWLLPRIHAAPDPNAQWQQLRRTVAYEAALLAVVIAVTGTLSLNAPDHTHQTGTVSASADPP